MADDAITEETTVGCAICAAKSALKRCSRCKSVAYCSREHQIQHWKTHKQTCRTQDCNSSSKHQNSKKVEGTQTSTSSCQIPSENGNTLHDGNNGNENGNGASDKHSKRQYLRNMDSAGHASQNAGATHHLVSLREARTSSQSQTYSDYDSVKERKERDRAENVAENEIQRSEFSEPSAATPFDQRPLKLRAFPQPRSQEFALLSKFVVEQLKVVGYCVIDGLLTEKHSEDIVSEVKHLESAGSFQSGKLAGGRTSGVNEEKVTNKNIRSDKIFWMEGNEDDYLAISQLVVGTMDIIIMGMNSHLDGKYSINGRTKAMVACYPGNGSAYQKHIDNPCKDGRVVTCIMYLNENWDVEKQGGVLRIFPAGTDDYVDVAPLMNRMLFFWSDARNPHEVQPAFCNRYAITVWYFDEVERQGAKTEQVIQETEKLQEDINVLEIRKKQLQKETIKQQIENEALKAVNLLSEGELEALSVMVDTHPDPKGLLTSLGINSRIQNSLLKILKTRDRMEREPRP